MTALGVVLAGCAALVPLVPVARAYRTSQDSLYNQGRGITGRIAFEPQPVVYSIYRGTTDVVLADLTAATATAFQTWTEPACTDLEIVNGGATLTPAIYGDDRNVLEWVEDGSWSGRGFSPFTIGVTTNQFLMVDGRWTIDESDMELNADDFNWVIDGGEPDADPVDVQGLVVHEAGHFLGLLHNCEATAFDGASACPASSEPETMWPRYTGENQRTLEADDEAGICFLYPAAGTPDAGVDASAPDTGTPDTGTSDAGTPDAASDGAPVDGTTDTGTSRPSSRSRGGCGCAIASLPEHEVGPMALGLGLLALSLWRRRGRRRPRVAQ